MLTRCCRHFWFLVRGKRKVSVSGVFKFRDEHLVKLKTISRRCLLKEPRKKRSKKEASHGGVIRILYTGRVFRHALSKRQVQFLSLKRCLEFPTPPGEPPQPKQGCTKETRNKTRKMHKKKHCAMMRIMR